MFRTLVFLTCCATLSCGNKHENKDATPDGTTVLEWDLGKTDQAPMKTATLEDKKPLDVVQVMAPADDTKVKLKLHLELATAKYRDGDQAKTARVLVAIKAVLGDGNDFTFHDGKCVGPKQSLAASTVVDCSIRTDRPGFEGGVFFEVFDDGRVAPGRMVLPETMPK